ncbi:MAG TPA: GNAT family N-acetyltransferase [Longimicrobium sp.]|jgi:GNAT superfamily N-acetyltransferase
MQRTTHVRPAAPEDTAALAALMSHLSYPTEPDAMRVRMERISALDGYAAWVAEAEGEVIGMVAAMIGWTLVYDDPFARILALVVDPAHRGKGAGAALVRTVEEWARTHGAGTLHLTAGNQRTEAHVFYRRMGFDDTGKRFFKRLG